MSKLGQVVNANEKAQSIISDMKKKVADITKKVEMLRNQQYIM